MEDPSRALQINLAVVQIVTTILITIGATILAIGVGFGIAIPSILDSVSEDIQASLQNSILSALNNYGFVLGLIGIVMIIMGVLYGSVSLAKVRKNSGKDL